MEVICGRKKHIKECQNLLNAGLVIIEEYTKVRKAETEVKRACL